MTRQPERSRRTATRKKQLDPSTPSGAWLIAVASSIVGAVVLDLLTHLSIHWH
ncbi:hypothetical protein EDD99_4369 [Streptomyces sp. 846.5]|nr:hypothetical protein EDD99_4369 [Streptomyces sp. 846.5]